MLTYTIDEAETLTYARNERTWFESILIERNGELEEERDEALKQAEEADTTRRDVQRRIGELRALLSAVSSEILAAERTSDDVLGEWVEQLDHIAAELAELEDYE